MSHVPSVKRTTPFHKRLAIPNPEYYSSLRPLKRIVPLNDAKLRYFYRALITRGFNVAATCRALEIDKKTAWRYCQDLRDVGVWVPHTADAAQALRDADKDEALKTAIQRREQLRKLILEKQK